MIPFRLDELRFVSEYSVTSAADATFHVCTDFVVPANTIRTLIAANYQSSVGESRYITFKIMTALGVQFSMRGPVLYDSNNGAPLALLEPIGETIMLPGDYIRFDRNAATAGSTMTFRARYVDHILPYQKFVDPLAGRIRRSPDLSHLPAAGGGGIGGGGGGGGPAEPGDVPGGGEVVPMV